MKKLLTTAAVLVALVAPAMAGSTPQQPTLVVDQTAIQATFYPKVQKYVVYVAFTGHNTLNQTYQMGTAHCSLFVEGKLIAPAVGVLMDIPALGTINGMAEGGLLDIKPDHAECTLSAAF
jgi:hypothetical protein